MLNSFKDKLLSTQLNSKLSISEELDFIREEIKRLVKEKFSSSFKIYIFDSGSCNGCELELQLLFSPLYNLSEYGIRLVYDPSKADALIITGLMTENIYAELMEIIKEFKVLPQIILLGDCPLSKSVFQESSTVRGEVVKIFPKAFPIGGCPPEPLTILDGFLKFLEKM